MKDKLRIAWFSDLSVTGDARSISAYVSEQLLPRLQKSFEIDLFHNSFEQHELFPTYHCLTAIRRHREQPYDIFFYQLEDSPATQWLRIHCGLMPGIQLSHDYLYTSFGPEPILNSPWKATLDRLADPAAAWPIRSDEQYQNGPQGIREASYAVAQLFSQPGMASESARLSEGSILIDSQPLRAYLPLPVSPELFEETAPDARRVLFCGSPWIQHRAHKMLHAVSEFDAALPVYWLIDAQEQVAAEELVREFGLRNVSLEIGRSAARWAELVSLGGVAIHTLFSVYGQTGPFLPISLAAGLPVLVTRFGHSEQLPDSVVYKIQPGDTEAQEIKGALNAILNDGGRPLPALVQSFANEMHSADSVAMELGLMFHSQRHAVTAGMERWEALKSGARRELLEEAMSLAPSQDTLLDERQRLQGVYKELQWLR